MGKKIIFLLVLTFGWQPALFAHDTLPGKSVTVYPSLKASRYKIILDSERIIVARSVDSLKDNTLYLTGKKGPQGVSVALIRKLLVAKNKRPGARGLAFGVLTGTATGALIGLASYRKPEPGDGWFTLDFGPGFSAFGGGLLGLIPGALTGTIIGASSYRYIHHDFSDVPPAGRAASLSRVLSGQ